MWNKRDFLTMAAAGALTFGITVAAFWTRAATAEGDSPSPIVSITTPVLHLQDCDVFAQLAPSDKVAPPSAPGGKIFIAAGKMPPIQLVLHNTRDTAVKASFVANLQSADPIRGGRVMRMSMPLFSIPYAIDLAPNETCTIDVEQSADLTAPSNFRLFLSKQPILQPGGANGSGDIVALDIMVTPKPVDALNTKVSAALDPKGSAQALAAK